MKAITSVWLVNGTTVATLTLTNIKDFAALALTLLSIAFTIHQWRKEKK